LNKKSAQKQKRLLTTASRKPLFHKKETIKTSKLQIPKRQNQIQKARNSHAGLYF